MISRTVKMRARSKSVDWRSDFPSLEAKSQKKLTRRVARRLIKNDTLGEYDDWRRECAD